MPQLPQTLGALKRSPFGAPERGTGRSRTRSARISSRASRAGGPLFAGVLGYEDTVVPQIVNALLSRHNFILLGLRGQAKSRILRALTDAARRRDADRRRQRGQRHPLRPDLASTRANLLAEAGDDTPIAWVGRDQRYVEKLATPDVTVADLIGDVDPIKAARGGHLLSDELTIHYGMLPRANRGIFALNELPDLAGKVQVGLFNIMQEGDVQIKGYPVRLPLDVLLCFTANPEDYTARGKIITPLKDRIGSEIITHYPERRSSSAWRSRSRRRGPRATAARRSTRPAASSPRSSSASPSRRARQAHRPPLGRVAAHADHRASRTSCRTPSGAPSTRRGAEVVPRISDVYAALPAITGKLELEYEGELVGGATIARELIRRAADATLKAHARRRQHRRDRDVVRRRRRAAGDRRRAHASTLRSAFDTVPGLVRPGDRARASPRAGDAALVAGACELVLEALVARRKISRTDAGRYGRATREEGRRRRGGGALRRHDRLDEGHGTFQARQTSSSSEAG